MPPHLPDLITGHRDVLVPPQMPDLKTGAIHWEAKHEKVGPFDGAAFVDVHAEAGGVTTQVSCLVVGSQ